MTSTASENGNSPGEEEPSGSANRGRSNAETVVHPLPAPELAAERLDEAETRDEASRERDLAAQERDHAAEARDRAAAVFEPAGPGAVARSHAAADRVRAAADRRRAAVDREAGAEDRNLVRTALSEPPLDVLTGAFGPGLGTLALQREINRARHVGGNLVLAFVDINKLGEVNNRDGRDAGDALLIDVAANIRSRLRSYDPIVRFGGDEFVCGFSDFDLAGVNRRFDDIRSALERSHEGQSICVGLAELQDGDTLDDLIERGDSSLFAAKSGL
jgi:diguanylate cyclase (GGDEF)-like protein